MLRRVAQPGSALAWGARGREFESRHADHFENPLDLQNQVGFSVFAVISITFVINFKSFNFGL